MTELIMHPASIGFHSDGCYNNRRQDSYCLRGLPVSRTTFTLCFPFAFAFASPSAFKQDKGGSKIMSLVVHKPIRLYKSVVIGDPTTLLGQTADFKNQTALSYADKGSICEDSTELEVFSSAISINQQEPSLHCLGFNQPLLDNVEDDNTDRAVQTGLVYLEEINEEDDNTDRAVQTGLVYLEEINEEELSKRILKLSRLNKIRSALTLYKSMEFSGQKPSSHACNSMLSCFLRNERLDDALSLFHSMKARKLATGHACSLILKAVANDLGCDAAQRLFEELESDDDVDNLFDTVVYNTMLSVFCKVNNWVQAENIWRSLQKKGFKGSAVTYRMLVCTFVRCGQNELAFDAYHEMVENGLIPSEDAMQAVIGACAKEGKCDLALSVFQNMLKHGFKPNTISFNALITSLGKFGKVNLAFKVYYLLESLGLTPDAYTWNALLGALNKANQPADALHLFNRIRKSHNSVINVQMYITVLMSCQKLGLWSNALQLLWEMEGSGIPLSVAPYNLVIGACEVARKPKVALQVYEHMVHKQLSPDVFTLLSLLRSCIWGSLWDDIEDILHRYPGNGSLYNAAIQGLCLCGNNDMAKEMYERMSKLDLKADGKTRAFMLQKLSKLKKKVHKSSYLLPRRRKRSTKR